MPISIIFARSGRARWWSEAASPYWPFGWRQDIDRTRFPSLVPAREPELMLVCRRKHRMLTRLLSLALLLVFVAGGLPAWAQEVGRHCAIHRTAVHAMSGTHSPTHSTSSADAVSWHGAPHGPCSHCPPAECETSASCSTTIGTSLAAHATGAGVWRNRSAMIRAGSETATSTAPGLPTPPPRSLI